MHNTLATSDYILYTLYNLALYEYTRNIPLLLKMEWYYHGNKTALENFAPIELSPFFKKEDMIEQTVSTEIYRGVIALERRKEGQGEHHEPNKWEARRING